MAIQQQWWEILVGVLVVLLLLIAFGVKIGIFKCLKSQRLLAFLGAEQRCGAVGPEGGGEAKEGQIWHSGADGLTTQGKER